jgi:hypothetical protein
VRAEARDGFPIGGPAADVEDEVARSDPQESLWVGSIGRPCVGSPRLMASSHTCAVGLLRDGKSGESTFARPAAQKTRQDVVCSPLSGALLVFVTKDKSIKIASRNRSFASFGRQGGDGRPWQKGIYLPTVARRIRSR